MCFHGAINPSLLVIPSSTFLLGDLCQVPGTEAKACGRDGAANKRTLGQNDRRKLEDVCSRFYLPRRDGLPKGELARPTSNSGAASLVLNGASRFLFRLHGSRLPFIAAAVYAK